MAGSIGGCEHCGTRQERSIYSTVEWTSARVAVRSAA